MHIPDDLHPADIHRREALIAALRRNRESRGIPRRQVADLLGISTSAVHALEQRTTWEARTICRYARALDQRIEWILEGLTPPDDADVMAVVLAAGDTSTPERADRVHWRIVCNDLARIRRARLTAAAMATRLRVTENAVHYWEANPDGSSVIAAQRHARALGGRLNWRLLPTQPVIVQPRTAA